MVAEEISDEDIPRSLSASDFSDEVRPFRPDNDDDAAATADVELESSVPAAPRVMAFESPRRRPSRCLDASATSNRFVPSPVRPLPRKTAWRRSLRRPPSRVRRRLPRRQSRVRFRVRIRIRGRARGCAETCVSTGASLDLSRDPSPVARRRCDFLGSSRAQPRESHGGDDGGGDG